jgi:short-subunit dehydrogenase
MNLDGATALVTGGSSGIGAATAEMLARRGAEVLLVGRDQVALHRVGKRIGGRTRVADLARGQAVDELLATLDGTPDLLVCNAGLGWAGELDAISSSEVDVLVQVNLLSHLRLARELVPAMARRGRGHLVLVSSIAGCLGVADEAMYAATKAALRVFGASVRMEVADRGVGVSVVIPGVVDTPFFARRGKPYDRRWPRPIPAEAVARELVDAVERGRAEVFVPRWLLLPTRLHGLAPGLVHTLQRHFA